MFAYMYVCARTLAHLPLLRLNNRPLLDQFVQDFLSSLRSLH